MNPEAAIHLPILDEKPKRSRTLGHKQIRRLAKQVDPDAATPAELAEVALMRPKRRSDCAEGARPCPFLSCKFHLAFDITPAGGLVQNFPGRELEELPATCALDVADRGGVTLEEVGDFLGVTRERIRQIETRALRNAGMKHWPDFAQEIKAPVPQKRRSRTHTARLPRVVGLLKERGPMHAVEIGRALYMRPANVYSALGTLIAKGQAARIGRGLYALQEATP